MGSVSVWRGGLDRSVEKKNGLKVDPYLVDI